MRKDILKVVLIGDGGVGKTSLRVQYIHRRFTNNYKATIGADFITKEIPIEDGKKVSMQIWDTAGQERFQSLGVAYYRGADACIIVYDVTNIESFQHVLNWQHEFIDKADLKDPSTYPFILIGNKIDSDIEERQVTKSQGKKMAKKMREQSIKETPHFELMNQQTKYGSGNGNGNSSFNTSEGKSYHDNLLALHQRTSSYKRYNYLSQEQEMENKRESSSKGKGKGKGGSGEQNNKFFSQDRTDYLSHGKSKIGDRNSRNNNNDMNNNNNNNRNEVVSGISKGRKKRGEKRSNRNRNRDRIKNSNMNEYYMNRGGEEEGDEDEEEDEDEINDDDSNDNIDNDDHNDDSDSDEDNESDNDYDFDNFKIPYFEVSAKLGSNVEDAFNYIARTVQLPKFEFLIEGDTINWDESSKNNSCCF